MAEKSPGSERDTQRIEAEIARLQQEIGRDAEKVAGIRRHRRIRTILSAVVGGILFGAPTFIVYSEAGLFAALMGVLVGFGVMQFYFLIVPTQFAIGSIVRLRRSAEEKLGLLFDERRRRIKEIPAEAAAVDSPRSAREDPCASNRRKKQQAKRSRR
jgi:hypothetical protein